MEHTRSGMMYRLTTQVDANPANDCQTNFDFHAPVNLPSNVAGSSSMSR